MKTFESNKEMIEYYGNLLECGTNPRDLLRWCDCMALICAPYCCKENWIVLLSRFGKYERYFKAFDNQEEAQAYMKKFENDYDCREIIHISFDITTIFG